MSTIFVTRKRWLKINPVFYLLLALFLILPGCGNGGVTHNPVRPEAEESTQAEESTEPEESSESEESTESEEGSGSEESTEPEESSQPEESSESEESSQSEESTESEESSQSEESTESEESSESEESTLAAGLYDENDNLLYSWSELENDYNFDVETDYSYRYDERTGFKPGDDFNNRAIPSQLTTRPEDPDAPTCRIVVPNGITRIGNLAFFRMYSLGNIDLPNSIETIGDCVFCGTRLTSIELPQSLTSIGKYAFSNMRPLKSVTIPHSVNSIGEYAFQDCDELISADLSGTAVTTLPVRIFSACDELTTVDLSNSSITSIEAYAFSGCRSLENITLPSTLEKIGERSFANCGSLTSLELPASLKEIHKESFVLCTNLTITYNGSTYTYEQLEDFFTAFASVSGHTVVE